MLQIVSKPKRGVYDPKSKEPYKLSRSKLELFVDCPKCFYLDRRFGIGRPGGMTFTLNNAVDTLLKKEFDIHRAKGEPHPLMKTYKINAIPFAHADLDIWRKKFAGANYLHKLTNFIITGEIDDLWINHKGELIIVDYKATSTGKDINLDDEYKQSYKRQVEIYQWLFKKNGFKVSNSGYFVYVNGKTDRKAFDKRLEFDVQIIKYDGSDKWVEKAILDAYKCLNSNKAPKSAVECNYCSYAEAREKLKK